MKKPSFLFLLWVAAIAIIYFHATDTFDQDLGRHLTLGKIILATKQVPKTNLFSYTNPNEPVFNSHWGSQVIFFITHQLFGISGLIVLSTIVNTTAFGLLFFLAQRRTGIFLAGLLFIPFSLMLLDRSWIRPEMFGNLFFAMLLVALFAKRVRKKLRWFFPVISFFWINLHISAVFGVFTIAAVLLEDTISDYRESLVNGKPKTPNSLVFAQAFPPLRVNFLIFALSLLTLLLNPYGPGGVFSAFTVLDKYGYTIVENQSWLFLRDFGFPLVSNIALGFLALFACLFMAFFTRRKPLISEVIILFTTSFLTLRFVRNEVLFAYSGYLTAAFSIARLRKRVRHELLLSCCVLLFAGFLIIHAHGEEGLTLGFGSRESYRGGVDFFLGEHLKGPIFNNFDIGGYLIYRLYPKELVFVDNRPEAYPVSFFENIYKPMQFYPDVFEKYVKAYGIQTIVWGRRDITPWSSAFLQSIAKNPNWKAVYGDDMLAIFVKNP